MEKTDAIKLLAIDDKPDNLTTLIAVVREAFPQTKILTATNGQAGIELAAAEDPDVILLDIVMPGMDGFEVCRRLKADDRIRDIPVIFLTALKTDTASRVKGLEAGAEGFLAKPLETVELTAQIRAMAKIKAANRNQRTEKTRLQALVAERTRNLELELSERKQAEEARRHSDERFRTAQEMSPDGFTILRPVRDTQNRVIDFTWVYENDAIARLNGTDPQKVVGQRLLELFPGQRDTRFMKAYQQVAESGESMTIEEGYSGESMQNQLWFRIVVVPMVGDIAVLAHDITERKRAETYREMGLEVLQILNEPGTLQESIRCVLAALKTRTGFDAVGLRLQEGEDFPYLAQDGFPADFMLTENTLVERGKDGGVCRGKDGNVCLECTCGLVISGQTDPSNPLFTKGGSFWTNDSFPLLDLPANQDPRLHPRNNCIHQGYASAALIPVRTKDRIVGLIQLNDKRKGRFTPETIEILEGIAAHIGSALMRKRAEEQRQEGFDLLENLAHLVPGVIYQYRLYPDGRSAFPFSSPGMFDIYEVTPEEVREDASVVFGRLHPEDHERVAEAIFQSARTLNTFHCEFRVVLPSQGLRWHWCQARPERAEDGGTLWHGIILDITDRKQAESELRRLSTAIEQSPEIIMITDTEATIQYVNPSFETITGYTREEALGQNPRFLKSGQQDAGVYTAMWTTLLEGRVWEGRMVNKCKDGSLYTEEASIAPVRDSSGAIINFVGIKRDITAELERENMFRQSQKMDSIGQLTGGIAHDFNNMLQAIFGFNEFMLETLPDTSLDYQHAKEIQKAAKRAAELTRDLLAFSRKLPMEEKEIALNETVRESKALLHTLLGEKIRLDLKLADDLYPILADHGQMTQIIMNLAVNARDAMPDGGRLTIATNNVILSNEDVAARTDVYAGAFVCLSVTDTGFGMSQEVQDHMFEPFFTTKELGKGTGLGTSVIFGIVKHHKGWIHVYSKEGQGTSMKVYLPALTDKQAVPHGAVPGIRKGKRILLVEDDPATCGLVVRILKTAGYELTVVASAEEALTCYTEKSGAFDLLFSDMVLPGKIGLELADELKARNPGLPVLLYSGYCDQRERWEGMDRKGFRFLQKPFTVATLLTAVYETLEN